MIENDISYKIIGVAFKIHSTFGSELLESVYKELLYHHLQKTGMTVSKEIAIPLITEEVKLDCGFRIDLLVNNKVVIEVKSVEAIHRNHVAQTLTYLQLGGYKLGLILNFGEKDLKKGIKRLVL